ncbi:MAG: glycosyltransferase [Clostridia bacterium]|nr:glycosyltransferase [Clostridia bacterium]
MCQERNVQVIRYEKNTGVAQPLYDGIECALSNNFKYVYTLDQDSVTAENTIDKLYEIISGNPQIAIAAVDHVPMAKDTDIKQTFGGGVRFVDKVITSGALSDAKIIKEIGNYIPEMFIDWVDTEMCYRVESQGYKIALTDEVLLVHNMGDPVQRKFLWTTCTTMNYSPFRLYHIWRNASYCFRKYKHNRKLIKRDKMELRHLKLKIILYEDNKFSKLKAIKKGRKDAGKFLKLLMEKR